MKTRILLVGAMALAFAVGTVAMPSRTDAAQQMHCGGGYGGGGHGGAYRMGGALFDTPSGLKRVDDRRSPLSRGARVVSLVRTRPITRRSRRRRDSTDDETSPLRGDRRPRRVNLRALRLRRVWRRQGRAEHGRHSAH
jgi:hypothetical protein